MAKNYEPTMWELHTYGDYPANGGEEELLEALEDCEDIRKYISTFVKEANEMTDEELAEAILENGYLDGIYIYEGKLYDVDRATIPALQF